MTRKTFLRCLLAGLLALTAVAPAEARRDGRQDERHAERRDDRRPDRIERAPRRDEARRDGVTLDEAVARVRRDTGGRVLSAEARDGRYRVKVLLPDGAVRVYELDARDGGRR